MEGYANLKAMLETTIQRLEESSGASGGEVRKGKRLLRELKNANEMAIERGKHDDYSEKVRTVTDFINQNRGELDEDNITDDGLGEGRRRHTKTKGKKTPTSAKVQNAHPGLNVESFNEAFWMQNSISFGHTQHIELD